MPVAFLAPVYPLTTDYPFEYCELSLAPVVPLTSVAPLTFVAFLAPDDPRILVVSVLMVADEPFYFTPPLPPITGVVALRAAVNPESELPTLGMIPALEVPARNRPRRKMFLNEKTLFSNIFLKFLFLLIVSYFSRVYMNFFPTKE